MKVIAPLAGLVSDVHINQGDQIRSGDVLVTMESMKMQVRVESESNGIVAHIGVRAGDQIERGETLVEVTPVSASNSPSSSTSEAGAADSPLPEQGAQLAHYQSFIERREKTLDQHRKVAVSKRHDKGYASARENLALLTDPTQFIEYGQFAVAAQRDRIDYEELKSSTAADGIITGIGNVVGISTAIVINDYTVLAGTQGYYHHQKLDRMLEIAKRRALPVIMYTEGGGGRPGDTDVTTVNSGLQCSSFGAWAGLSGTVPRIAVANGFNFAGNAALFGAADITIATRRAWIGMAGPAMIEGGGLGSFHPTDIGPSEVQSGNGTVDLLVADEHEAAVRCKQVLSLISEDHASGESDEQTSLRAHLPANRRQTYNMRTIITTLCDSDSFLELSAGHGGAVITGLARLNGKRLGIIASDCLVLGGAIDVSAGEKTARFMQLCDSFEIPILVLCDTPGFMVGPEHEEKGAVRRLAELFKVGAQLTTPLYAVVVRKCYGLGAQALLGGSTKRPDACFAWPTGEFGPMGLEGAVKLGFAKELAACKSDEERSALFDELLQQLYQRGQASEVASVLEIDAVIDPAQTRAVLIDLMR